MLDVLHDVITGRVEENAPLARFTTYRLGGPARLLIEPANLADLEVIASEIGRRRAAGEKVAVLPLGRGSNVVVSDRGWPGLVVRLGDAFQEISGDTVLTVGAATTMPVLANHAARRARSGLEFMIAIPGSVGGGVRMNAGAHGSDVSDTLSSIRLLAFSSGAFDDVPAAELGLSYRRSRLTDDDLVISATFTTPDDDPAAVKGRMEEFRRHRAATQPGAAQNAGSVFKNPPGDHAARLVEAAGLKGFRVGGAEVSPLHANFFIAHRGSSASDVHSLVGEVRRRVLDRFGIDLEPEIRFVGDFDGASGGVMRTNA
ncbi:MAG TPA: UDP-N-acetylmuramate dehydrogenase [Actinomycetota bacterium]|nr:UDP-N-acetylmuramate dehydrogenase [Actinomycetota bacterium]